VEIDLDAVPVPLSRDRLLGLQHELQEALSEGEFQDRLCECERTLGRGTMEFRRQHQQLVLEVQSEILPKYGFEASLDGVARMLADVRAFQGDSEVAANIEAINALIWRPRESRPEDASRREHHGQAHGLDWLHRWGHQRHMGGWAHPERAGPTKTSDLGSVGVEIDLDAVEVPLVKDRLLGLQGELRERLSAPDFQARLRECEGARDDSSLEFRKKHQQLVLGVQAKVLPKYGFEGSLQGVHDLMEAVGPFREDPDVAANLRALDGLIWGSCATPDAKAAPRRPGV